jgi:crotonyl-CoA reductase
MVKNNPSREEHLRDYQIIGSDAAGLVVEVGSAVTKWSIGDEVVVHCNVVDKSDPITRRDELLSSSQAIWGYETNFGAFAEFAVVKEQQLHRRPQHLTWEESASYMLTFTTAYRMLISTNGAQLMPGETCLIWGAAGGLGLFAVQLAKMIGAIPIAVVSSDERANACQNYGAEHFLFRNEMKHELLTDGGSPNPLAWREMKQKLLRQGIDAPDVVFEHVGRETLGASVYLARRGGRIVTCAASSGFESVIDLRYLWMQVKRIIGSHIGSSDEAMKANDLIDQQKIRTTVSVVAPFSELSKLIDDFHAGKIVGKAVVSVPN